jgi:hypothetical protein
MQFQAELREPFTELAKELHAASTWAGPRPGTEPDAALRAWSGQHPGPPPQCRPAPQRRDWTEGRPVPCRRAEAASGTAYRRAPRAGGVRESGFPGKMLFPGMVRRV